MADYPTSIPSFTANNSNTPLSAFHENHHDPTNGLPANLIAGLTKLGTGASTPTAGQMLVGSGTGSSAWTNTLTAASATTTPLTLVAATSQSTPLTVLKAAAGQTGTVTSWQKSNGTVYAEVLPPGSEGGLLHVVESFLTPPVTTHQTGIFSQVVGVGTSSASNLVRVGAIRLTAADRSTVQKVNITGAFDNGSGLIRLTTDPHTMSTGDGVGVELVTGTTEANGRWLITVIDSTHIDLIGSTFANAYVSGGTISNAGMLSGAIIEVGPRVDRSDFTGSTANHGADVAGLTVANTGQGKGQDAVFVAASNAVVGGNGWRSVFTSATNADRVLYASANAYTYGVDLQLASFATAAIALPNNAPISARSTSGTLAPIMWVDTDNFLRFASALGSTWTPVLTFGGASTGLTYTTRGGTWRRIGDMLWCTGFFTLSSKGSSTGQALITGLPFTVSNATSAGGPGSTQYSAMLSMSGMIARPVANSTTAELRVQTATDSNVVTNANFTDTSTIVFSFWYRV